ncbi:hypothetical protein D0399_04680 [Staphylococcus epidermidis]|uniref:hypothetical protein n=1 Tax=Staphylococcus epidermidis TaxID=1282 RepID=UPI0009AC10F5|nr:hypothetical protein [Staphylococcus epidermidis]KAB2282218.1 hypothetical protein F9B71_00670 [Staphylococcus epidermidis]MBM0784931.1 hypothetical protein [Staphylococcus epidermidis]MBM0796854.1 hypothetical protein [Staphylococcus epidermidis]MBM0799611.1 hypothetical protein [Staphylococcus epidermidis]MBM0836702.1 hypothetical protein [Staphylococcus epidermidis]
MGFHKFIYWHLYLQYFVLLARFLRGTASVLIPTNDISRHVNDIAETIPDTEFDEFRHHRGLI